MGQQAGQVQHDDEQRHLEGNTEGQQHRHDEAHVLIDLDQVADVARGQAEGHAALGVVLPLRAHVALAHDAGALNGAGEFRHDRFPQNAGLAGLVSPLRLSRHADQVCGVGGGRPLQVTELLL